jgi:hypothetical protein
MTVSAIVAVLRRVVSRLQAYRQRRRWIVVGLVAAVAFAIGVPAALAWLRASRIEHACQSLLDGGSTVVMDWHSPPDASWGRKLWDIVTGRSVPFVKSVIFGPAQGDEEVLKLSAFPSIVSLDLSGSQVTDHGLTLLRNLATLEVLDVSRTQVGDSGLEHVRNLPNLKKLIVAQTRVDGSFLGDCPSGIEFLDASGTVVSTDHIGAVPSLQTLVLRRWKTDRLALDRLASLPHLTHLDLSGTELTNDDLRGVRQLRSLESLSLIYTSITSDGLGHIARCPALRTLDLRSTAPGDEGLASLAACQSLEVCDVSDTDITSSGVRRFQAARPDVTLRGPRMDTTEAIRYLTFVYDEGIYQAPYLFVRRASPRFEVGEREGAMDDVNRALELDPTLSEGYELRGRFFLDLGEIDKAIADLSKAIEVGPSSLAAYDLRLQCNKRLGELDRALSDCEKCIELAPQDPQYALQKATLLRELKKVNP